MGDRTQTSKFLAYVLRHHPGAIDLELDEGGWARVDRLVEAARASGRDLDRETVEAVVEQDEKDRYSLDASGDRIRANYGHSVDIDLGLKPETPPRRLAHGTARRHLESIRRDGLKPGSRQWVHLQKWDESGRQTARRVGSRHGEPVLLEVLTERVDEPFYRSEAGIWLVARVPPEALVFPDEGAGNQSAEQA